ncbi:polysaccharide pyruvyl transferase family protein [Dietzia sp. PP-33]|uniref:polysaccharide pyruvyl transferase family protein n=1 Tax=Dietzia sp. PP-33 TaxID=2957500 RepID=UPI0029BCB34B|nr:polysaccharide pyruvyl transferase family protein [Dietzia sp. PP-33]MDX2358776.1 polysaccharide pyruvyl transferase family protein [Dietzia sp. PP-33]
MSPFPTTDGLLGLIQPWAQGSGYVIELRSERGKRLGNNGDRLLDLAFEKLVNEFGMTLASLESKEPDYLVLPPNGALVDTYEAPSLLARRIATLPDKPLILFPSSALFRTKDPAEIFSGRTAPTLWILREKHSFDHLSEQWDDSLQARNVTLALDHDVVVSGHRHIIPRFKSVSGSEGNCGLLVSRLGVEATDMRTETDLPSAGRIRNTAVSAFNAMPQYAKIAVRRQLTRHRQLAANQEMISSLPPDLAKTLENIGETARDVDISDPTLCSFERFVEKISTAQYIVTNRLHVAIPGTILGKRVILVDSGYHKLAGVFEQSLQAAENLTFLRRDE